LENYLEPLLAPELEHLQTIRIGTESLTFWPQRFVTDDDADELLALFTKLVKNGKHLAFMAHFNHWQEMETPIVREAIRRIRSTGAVIRTQAPVVQHKIGRASCRERGEISVVDEKVQKKEQSKPMTITLFFFFFKQKTAYEIET